MINSRLYRVPHNTIPLPYTVHRLIPMVHVSRRLAPVRSVPRLGKDVRLCRHARKRTSDNLQSSNDDKGSLEIFLCHHGLLRSITIVRWSAQSSPSQQWQTLPINRRA